MARLPTPPSDASYLFVEQLDHGHWHACDFDTGWSTGAKTWPAAISTALVAAIFTAQGIKVVDLNDSCRLILYPEEI